MYSILFLLSFLSSKNSLTNYNNCNYNNQLPLMELDSVSPPSKSIVKIKELAPKRKKKEKKISSSLSIQNKVKKNKAKAKQDTSILTINEQIALLARKKETPFIPNKIHPDQIQNCVMAYDIIDEFTGRQKKGLFPRTFFTFTPENYRKFLKDKDFIHCEGFLTQSTGQLMTLNIKLTIASKDAHSKFGAIKAGSLLALHSMDNKHFFLTTYAGAKPITVGNNTVYECSFSIQKSMIKKLKKIELDQVKVTFERGSFTYDIYYLDFLKDQFPCFTK